jgi:chloramphenicol 3-O phosphotransferase
MDHDERRGSPKLDPDPDLKSFIGGPAPSVRGPRPGGDPPRRAVRGLYSGVVTTQVIVLNGGSSSGKSGIVRCLQAVLADPWLALGIDMLVEAMPASMQTSETGIEFAADGGVNVGPQFRRLQAAWQAGVATMVRAGARVIIDDVFLGGGGTQRDWQQALAGLSVLWVGVHCESTVAEGREIARGDRVRGMAAAQATLVHQGVTYDLEVDTTRTESLACARIIAARAA